jgi:hypothetical protein
MGQAAGPGSVAAALLFFARFAWLWQQHSRGTQAAVPFPNALLMRNSLRRQL